MTDTHTRLTLLASHRLAHLLFKAIAEDLREGVAEKTFPGATISRISPILAHAVLGEDITVNAMLLGRPTVLLHDGWVDRTGIRRPTPAMDERWLEARFNLRGLTEYAEAVFSSTEETLTGLKAEVLGADVQSPIGTKVSGAELLSSFNLLHLMMHAGEIAALKGVQGVPGGLPF